MKIKYPLENLTDIEFEDLVALICEKILGTGTIVFSEGKDGGKDARFKGKANNFPSISEPWHGKIIIQAKHTNRVNASCSESDFQSILKKSVLPAINSLTISNEIDYYLLFTNRKLSGIQDKKIEDIFEDNIEVENIVIGIERIDLWLKEYPIIAKTLKLNRLLLPLDFNENDLKEIISTFSNLNGKSVQISFIPEARDIQIKNALNKLSEEYFNNMIKKNIIYFDQIRAFLTDTINLAYLNKYENTIEDINAEIIVHRDEYDKFEAILEYLYKFILVNNPSLENNRRLVRLFLHYMYYNCDIGLNE